MNGASFVFDVDPGHPLGLREELEVWLRPWRSPHEAGLRVWLPTAESLARGPRPRGTRVLLVRPRSRDLLGMQDDAHAEERADAVLDVGEEGRRALEGVLQMWWRSFVREEGRLLDKISSRDGRVFGKAMKSALVSAEGDPGLRDSCADLFLRFLEVEEDLLARPDWEALEKDLETLARRLDKKKNWRLLRPGEREERREGTLFVVGRLQGVPVAIHHAVRDPGPLEAVAAHLVVAALGGLLRRWEGGAEEDRPGALVRAAFQALPFPVLLLGQGDEVLQHNTAFARLNMPPSKVARLKDRGEADTREGIWDVRRRELGNQRVMYSFRAQDLRERSGFGGQDLGIITSSIAHELNNPLAGLLTALELMAGDPGWDEASRGELQEMRQGALRCKQLVETFLGFSRPHAGTPASPDKGLLWRCCEQALHLQRFRMVESGLRLQFSHLQRHPYAYPVHAPSMAMVVYLVLGEYMTGYHHLKLLERQSAKGLVVEGEIEEDADRFFLRFTGMAPKTPAFASQLLQYLLGQERLQMLPRPDGLVFLHQNVLL